ncbi:MAG TPA: carboxylate-amine ligase, partial [Xanthomonadales bacterium]|nr:carboxylate-amine ligase [Xanthomonadales bacterium]
GCVADARSIWWTIRPASRYPTLELRIADACTDLDDALCIAALFRCLVRASLGGDDAGFDRAIVEENRWRAKRYGVEAAMLSQGDGAAVSVDALAESLVRRLRPHALALDCEAEIEHVHAICAAGGGAGRQVEVHDEALRAGVGPREALRCVVEDLVARTETPGPGERLPARRNWS